jgi:hypothetical protein
MEIFPSRFIHAYRRRTKLSFFIGKKRLNLRTHTTASVWEVPSADSEMFLRMPAGGWAGCFRPIGLGTLVFITYDFSAIFNTSGLYKMKEAEIEARRILAKIIMDRIGIERPLDWAPAKAEVWARRAPKGKIFLFCVNDGDAAGLSIRPALPQILGINMNRDYRIHRIYADKELAIMSARQMIENGITLPMKKWESEVLLLEPKE